MDNKLSSSFIREEEEYGQLLEAVGSCLRTKPMPILVGGLCEGAVESFLVSLLDDLPAAAAAPSLILCPNGKSCRIIRDRLSACGISAEVFPPRDLNLYNITASHDFEHERLQVLTGILKGTLSVVVSTPDAALSYTIPPAVLKDATLVINKSDSLDLPAVSRALVDAGYIRCDLVDGIGQFSVRGGIIDIYPPYADAVTEAGSATDFNAPVRIELIGDEIDRMTLFDTATQRSIEQIDRISIPPAREILPGKPAYAKLKKVLVQLCQAAPTQEARTSLESEIHAVEAGSELLFIDKYISLVYPEAFCLLDYLPERNVCFLLGTNALSEQIKTAESELFSVVNGLIDDGMLPEKYARYSKSASDFVAYLERRAALHLDSFTHRMSGTKMAGLFSFQTRQPVSYATSFELLIEDLGHLIDNRFKILLEVENQTAASNASDLLRSAGFRHVVLQPGTEIETTDFERGTVYITSSCSSTGYELLRSKAAVVSLIPAEAGPILYSGRSRHRKTKRSKDTKTILSYAELNVGDYVVHDVHGIGIYMGLEKLTVEGITHDYISIKYDGSDKLFIPVEKLDRIAKYIGANADDKTLKLSKLGSDSWGKAKAKTKSIAKQMAKELLMLYAERSRKPGFVFPPDDALQEEFESSFPYEETTSQLNAIEDIKKDMEKPVPMDRLLCGDVGYGKTEVALRAAFKAVLAGKQVAFLVPTTILAFQHYQTATSRMRSFAVSIDMVSRFKTPKQNQISLDRLRRGETDILIGTHRLLSADIEFKNLGLLIVDEEQRFGVAQKEKIKQLAPNVDVLTLTATPIPRTMNMAMNGIRDISLLDEAPGERQPVQTYVLEYDDLIVTDAIKRELHRGGQVFYLHNVIEDILDVRATLEKAIPGARIGVAHGKMPKEELEDTWNDMLSGQLDILVATSIIENGIDIPNANTLIVTNAHRLGLAQLHQIRGRIGRSSRKAYAYLTYPRGMALSELSEKRLDAIREYTEFGAGFNIAIRDMEIRGIGNLLGTEQHGNMDSVGYDMYIKLVNEAILEERGQTPPEPDPECVVSLNFDAYLPESYVPASTQRIALYKKIAMIHSQDDQDDIADELLDRFGDMPPAADNLIRIALIKSFASRCGMKSVKQEGRNIIIVPYKFDREMWVDMKLLFGKKLQITTDPILSIQMRFGANEDILRDLHKLFEKYLELANQQ